MITGTNGQTAHQTYSIFETTRPYEWLRTKVACLCEMVRNAMATNL